MGLREILTGRRKLSGPAPDRLFAMSTAFVTMRTAYGERGAGRAALVFRALDTADFASLLADAEELLRARADDAGTTVESSDDAFGYRWLVVGDDEMEDLVAAVDALATSLADGGYGDRLLCAVFAFRGSDAGGATPFYWIYNVKRGTFYPFAPVAGAERRRDAERELVLRARMANELPVEPELERSFALWGIPL